MRDDLYTMVTIGEDNYRIKKFTSINGLQIARLVVSKLAPLIPLIVSDSRNNGVEGMAEVIGEAIGTLEDKDIETLVKKCLRNCEKMLKLGPVRCIDENGNYGVEDLEYDIVITIQLVVEAIKWGAGDFFGEKASGLRQILNLGSKQSKA